MRFFYHVLSHIVSNLDTINKQELEITYKLNIERCTIGASHTCQSEVSCLVQNHVYFGCEPHVSEVSYHVFSHIVSNLDTINKQEGAGNNL